MWVSIAAHESSSRRIQSARVQPNVTVKAFSSLFVATELSSLLRTQNADSKGQLPLQRQSSKQMLLWIRMPVGGGVSVKAGLHAHSTPSLSYLHWKLRNHRCPPTGLLTHQGDAEVLRPDKSGECPWCHGSAASRAMSWFGPCLSSPVYQALSYR